MSIIYVLGALLDIHCYMWYLCLTANKELSNEIHTNAYTTEPLLNLCDLALTDKTAVLYLLYIILFMHVLSLSNNVNSSEVSFIFYFHLFFWQIFIKYQLSAKHYVETRTTPVNKYQIQFLYGVFGLAWGNPLIN